MHDANNASPINFTIDGQSFTTDDATQSPASLLAFVGFDTASYDLMQMLPDGKPHKFQDGQTVHIKNGEEFLTVRKEASVA